MSYRGALLLLAELTDETVAREVAEDLYAEDLYLDRLASSAAHAAG